MPHRGTARKSEKRVLLDYTKCLFPSPSANPCDCVWRSIILAQTNQASGNPVFTRVFARYGVECNLITEQSNLTFVVFPDIQHYHTVVVGMTELQYSIPKPKLSCAQEESEIPARPPPHVLMGVGQYT